MNYMYVSSDDKSIRCVLVIFAFLLTMYIVVKIHLYSMPVSGVEKSQENMKISTCHSSAQRSLRCTKVTPVHKGHSGAQRSLDLVHKGHSSAQRSLQCTKVTPGHKGHSSAQRWWCWKYRELQASVSATSGCWSVWEASSSAREQHPASYAVWFQARAYSPGCFGEYSWWMEEDIGWAQVGGINLLLLSKVFGHMIFVVEVRALSMVSEERKWCKVMLEWYEERCSSGVNFGAITLYPVCEWSALQRSALQGEAVCWRYHPIMHVRWCLGSRKGAKLTNWG